MRWLYIFVFALVLAIAGCSKPDPTIILGSWRAQSFQLESLKLPISPSFEVTRNELILKSPDGVLVQKIPLNAIRAEGKNIELEFKNGFGVSVEFIVESRDRIHFIVPIVAFDVAYDRVN